LPLYRFPCSIRAYFNAQKGLIMTSNPVLRRVAVFFVLFPAVLLSASADGKAPDAAKTFAAAVQPVWMVQHAGFPGDGGQSQGIFRKAAEAVLKSR
jgi:hypothetical protein